VRPDPQTLLRSLAKFVAVVVVAGLVGAGVGIALAQLSGDDGSDTPASPAAVSATTAQTTAADGTSPTTETQPRSSTAAASETTASSAATARAPTVRVLSALLGRRSYSTGRALVAVRIRVTNRAGRPLVVDGPVLLSDQDGIRPNASPSGASFPPTLAPGASATGTLRFIIPPGIAQRLHAKPAARLRIAKRTVVLTLKKG
jgi:hypothetical protein